MTKEVSWVWNTKMYTQATIFGNNWGHRKLDPCKHTYICIQFYDDDYESIIDFNKPLSSWNNSHSLASKIIFFMQFYSHNFVILDF